MKIKLFTVVGSPIKGGNCETYTREALKAVEDDPDVESEIFLLSDWKTPRGCHHCNYCATRQKPDRFCAINDELTKVYPKVLEADALLLSTPAYACRLTGQMACFMDRLRVLYHGNLYKGSLENKAASVLTVAFGRHAGVETTMLSVIQGLLMWEVLPVTLGLWGPYGSGGLTSYGGEGKVDPDDRDAICKDEFAMKEAKILCRKLVETAKVIKAGNRALNKENRFVKMYREAVGP